MTVSAADQIGIVGFGAIGRTVATCLQADARLGVLSAVLVRPHQADTARAALPASVTVATTLEALLARPLTLVVECAGQPALTACAKPVLETGTDLMVISTGALAADGMLEALTEAAARNGARLLVPAGAIAGLDGLGALKAAGLTRVRYTSTKPPLAWRGTPAETRFDLTAITAPTIIYEGSAREAALAYPKNANLAATVALAGLGLDRTEVRLIADPDATGNTGMIEADSEVGTLSVTMAGKASDNPKTSASTAFSLVHAIRNRSAVLVL